MDTTTASSPFFRQKHPVTISFAIGILLFLLPFAELKCAGMTLASNTGLGIAIGSNWDISMPESTKDLLGKMNESEDGKINEQLGEIGPNIFAIVSIVAAIFGIAIYLSAVKPRYLLSMCAGILAAVMLLAVMIAFRVTLGNALSDDSKSAAI